MNFNEVIKTNNFEFKKKFGQNFISDSNLLKGIVRDAGVEINDQVLEIGVGAGALTRAISESCQKVVGIEIDKELVEIHKQTLQGLNNVTIVFNDFMKMTCEQVNSLFEKQYKVVANLPYYITTPIIFKIIEEDFNVESLTLMVQKEVADRLVSKCGSKDYGAITVQLASIANVSIKRQVGRQMFNPVPNVDSSIVRIDINRQKFNINNYKLHKKLIECAFSMRRKTLSNCLKSYFSLTKEQITQLLVECNLSETIRGEALSVEQFVEMSNKLSLLING